MRHIEHESVFHHRDTCCLCGSERIIQVCSISELPYRSPNVGGRDEDPGRLPDNDLTVPLCLYFCEDCCHLQLADIVSPQIQYSNYRYQTTISKGLPKHFEDAAAALKPYLAECSGQARVLEFGSNDGTFLRHLKSLGCEVLGVEPARSIAKAAEESGVPTESDFFSSGTAAEIGAKHGKFDIVAANYVFANVEEVADVVRGVSLVLKPNGVFVFETQYGVDVIENLLIDTIYHEHISYFNVVPLVEFFRQHSMEVVDVQRIPTKGGSIRVVVAFQSGERLPHPRVESCVSYERLNGFDSIERYQLFAQKVVENREAVLELLSQFDDVAGFGASVGTVTLLHHYGVEKRIRFICDDNPLQERLEGPNYAIPVVSGEALYTDSVDAVLLFAWRYADAIVPKHKRFLYQGGRFIVPLPRVELVHHR